MSEAFVTHMVRMKGCGKSAPRLWQQSWQGKPHPEQDQIGIAYGAPLHRRPGRSRELAGNSPPRVMIVTEFQYRTRLIDPLTFSCLCGCSFG